MPLETKNKSMLDKKIGKKTVLGNSLIIAHLHNKVNRSLYVFPVSPRKPLLSKRINKLLNAYSNLGLKPFYELLSNFNVSILFKF